jgi:formate dehydrogenase assembly factor FdhD
MDDYLAVNEPLEMRAGRQSLGITLRTPGHDLELAAGFLLTEGIMSRREQLVSSNIAKNQVANTAVSERNIVRVRLGSGAQLRNHRPARRFSPGSAGNVVSADPTQQRVSIQKCFVTCHKSGAAQVIVGRTGGLHAAALFDHHGNLLALREFEVVQKALVAGVPLLASVSVPSSLAVQSVRELGLTLVGFARPAIHCLRRPGAPRHLRPGAYHKTARNLVHFPPLSISGRRQKTSNHLAEAVRRGRNGGEPLEFGSGQFKSSRGDVFIQMFG